LINLKTYKEKAKIVIRVELTGTLKDKFCYLLEYYGAKTGTHLVRQLINLKYQEFREKK